MAKKQAPSPSPAQPAETGIGVITSPDTLRGLYSNVVVIGHTREEFLLDFLLAARGQTFLVSRVVLSPGHARRLVKALQDQIEKYDKQVTEDAGSKK